jgi:hypothetical protein
MVKHIISESKFDRKYRRIQEHNKKVITEHFHLNYDKYTKKVTPPKHQDDDVLVDY